jgi:hypothetical protein
MVMSDICMTFLEPNNLPIKMRRLEDPPVAFFPDLLEDEAQK